MTSNTQTHTMCQESYGKFLYKKNKKRKQNPNEVYRIGRHNAKLTYNVSEQERENKICHLNSNNGHLKLTN